MKPKGLFILEPLPYQGIYVPDVRQAIEEQVDIYAPLQTRHSIKEDPSVLHDLELLFTGWTSPAFDSEFLDAAPNLKVVFYGAGTIKSLVTPEFWERGIIITHSADANAIPVAQVTLSQIIFCLKGGWYYERQVRQAGDFVRRIQFPGVYKSTVGIISLGLIGRRVCELLKMLDVRVIVYDPYVDQEIADSLGVTLVDTLEDIFEQSHVVSLHAPWLPATEGMIRGKHFKMMQQRASFINTSRGAIVCEDEMIEVLQERDDLFAVLDVTYPEPPVPGSPLYTLPNVVLLPHMAGATDLRDTGRLGETMLHELERYLQGEPLQHRVRQEQLETMA